VIVGSLDVRVADVVEIAAVTASTAMAGDPMPNPLGAGIVLAIGGTGRSSSRWRPG
jgi:hypothetical protein